MKVLSSLLVVAAVGCASPAAAQDAIDLHQATIHNSPADVAEWPATTTLTAVQLRPAGDPLEGVSASFDAKDRWPAYFPAGWQFPDSPAHVGSFGDNAIDGALQYTVWACVDARGWQCAGFIQMWRTRPSTGAALPSAWSCWWGPCGSVTAGVFGDYVPKPGDQIAIFVSAGDARGNRTVTSVRERSNVMLVTLTANDTADAGQVAHVDPPPPPPANTPPVAPPAVTWSHDVDLDELLATLTALRADVEALKLRAAGVERSIQALDARALALEAKPIVTACSASVFGVPIHCSLK